MSFCNPFRRAALIFVLCLVSSPLYAVSVNVGWHNPPISTWGLNFLSIGSKWGFELGIGQLSADTDNNDDDTTSDDRAAVALGGAVSGKYFFAGSSSLRAYAQVGIGVGLTSAVGNHGGASAGAGGLYAGLGILAGSEKFYLYVSGNLSSTSNFFPQIGVGVGI